MRRAERVAAVALATGWPPSEVRGMSMLQLDAVERRLVDIARERRMRASAGRARPGGRRG